MSAYSTIRVHEAAPGVAQVTLNRPEAANALSTAMGGGNTASGRASTAMGVPFARNSMGGPVLATVESREVSW